VAKDISDLPGEAAMWGSTVHKHLEERVRDGTTLPPSIRHYETLLVPILHSSGEKIVEQQFAITQGLQPTTWTADDAWCRGIVDVGVVAYNKEKALLLDWKTGKRKPDNDQLMLFAGLAFAHYPEMKYVNTGFVWLKDQKIDKQFFKREDVPTIWTSFVKRVSRMEKAYSQESFPPKPSGLCSRYCPVPHAVCEFSGRR
jgi:hypothetical protein